MWTVFFKLLLCTTADNKWEICEYITVEQGMYLNASSVLPLSVYLSSPIWGHIHAQEGAVSNCTESRVPHSKPVVKCINNECTQYFYHLHVYVELSQQATCSVVFVVQHKQWMLWKWTILVSITFIICCDYYYKFSSWIKHSINKHIIFVLIKLN